MRGALLLLLLAAPGEAQAPPAPRLVITVSPLLAPSSSSSSSTRTFTEFQEQGDVTTSYDLEQALGGELSLDYRVKGALGIRAAFVRVTRPGTGQLVARVPHPLYFARPREASLDIEDVGRTAFGLHPGLSWHSGQGRVRLTLLAGPSLLKVSGNVLADGAPRYQHSYPFDDVRLEQPARASVSGSAFGGHAGGVIDVRVSGAAGLALQARYVHARTTVDDVLLDGGGFDVALGISLSR